MLYLYLLYLGLVASVSRAWGFQTTPNTVTAKQRWRWSEWSSSPWTVHASSSSSPSPQGRRPSKSVGPPSRRQVLLSRTGAHFWLDRMAGRVEFGATAKLLKPLETDNKPNPQLIAEWLADGRALPVSIWDEALMTEIRPSIYRLQTMNLQFVTIQLAPSVDVKMQTRYTTNNNTPVFLLQSVGFDPNIQLSPGISMSADDLGIEIEVSGELRPTKDGTGVSGRIAFQTSGILPPPFRILPEPVLKAATEGINQAIVNLAVESFQKGATAKYEEFRRQALNNNNKQSVSSTEKPLL